MESYKFLNKIYEHFGDRSIHGIYTKAHETLTTIEMGDLPIDTLAGEILQDFGYIGRNLIAVLRRNITHDVVKHFLQTKQSYMMDRPPERRMDWNWTTVPDRHIK